MKVKVEDIGPIEKKVTLTVDTDVVTEEIEDFLERAAKQVTIPGFRKGAAPKHIIRNHMSDAIDAQVSVQLTTLAVQEYLRDADLSPAGEPVVVEEDRPRANHRAVGNFNMDGTYTVTVTIELVPELEAKNYTGLETSFQKPDLDQWISRAVGSVQDQFATLVPAEGTATIGHQLTLELHPDEEITTVMLSENLDDSLLSVLLGKKPGDAFETPDGQKGIIHSIDVKELPVANDEMAQLAGFESLDQLENQLKFRAENEYARQIKSNIVEGITDELLKHNSFEVPRAWVSQEMNLIAQRMQIKELGPGKELDSLKLIAERSVRRSFVLDKIYEQEESIHLSTDELYALLQAEAAKQGIDGEEYLTNLKNSGQYESFASLHQQMRAIDFLIDSSIVKEKDNE